MQQAVLREKRAREEDETIEETRLPKFKKVDRGVVLRFGRGISDDAYDYKSRVALYEAASRYRTLNPDQCRFDKIIARDLRILTSNEKSSASSTVILLGSYEVPIYMTEFHGNKRVAIKMSFEATQPGSDNSLEIERQVYRSVTNPLILNGNTPHIMLYVTELHCPKFRSSLGSMELAGKHRDALITIMKDIDDEGDYNTNDMHMLVLEQGSGGPLGKLLDEKKLPQENIPKIVFQVMWTLLCFEQVGLQQNDLHLGNVWIDILPSEKTLTYAAGTLTWSIRTKYIAKIYDFDRATKSATKYHPLKLTNRYLQYFCKTIGQCNGFTRFFDAFYFFHELYERNILRAWITEVVFSNDETAMKQKYAWRGLPCVCQQTYLDGDCKLCKIVTVSTHAPIQRILDLGFNHFLVANPAEMTAAQRRMIWRLPSENPLSIASK